MGNLAFEGEGSMTPMTADTIGRTGSSVTLIFMIQRVPAPAGLPILLDFWTAAYQAIDD